MSDSAEAPKKAPSELLRLEREERRLWRSSLLLMLLLALGVALTSWDRLRQLPQRLEALPVGVVVLVALFVAYFWGKKREISRLRGIFQVLEERAAAPPSGQQLEQLISVITGSQRRYRDLIDSLDHFVFTLSLDGTLQVANLRCAELLGVPIKQLVARRLDEFITEPDRTKVQQALPRFLDRRAWSGAVRLKIKATGETRYLDCVLHAVVKDGSVVGVSGLGRDITHQRESEARFTELFETVQEGVYFSTPEGRIFDVNPAFVRMLGYASKEELVAVNATELHVDAEQRKRMIAELERSGTIVNRETILRRKDGATIVCLNSATAVRDGAGHITRFQGTVVDITERRDIERRLVEEKEFVRRLIASFPDSIVVLDRDGRYTFVSNRIEESLGYKPEELVGRSLGERTNSEDRVAMMRLFENLISGRDSSGTVEYRTKHKDGSWRLLRASASPIHDAEGKIIGVVASARDVTTVKQLEQQVLQKEKLAAMGQMIAGVAHELNNPLTAILGVSDLLGERAGDDASRRQVGLLQKQARRAVRIVQELLAFSRPAMPNRSRLNLNDLVHRVLDLQEQVLADRNIRVAWVPAAGRPEIVGDSNQLLQVFLNIIENAEQAIREVRDSGEIRVSIVRSDGRIVTEIQDNGPGIPAEIQHRIFDPFFTTKRPGGGTGLGLTICLAIIRGHGGNIEIQPAAGGGTTFRVSLPGADAAEETEKPSAQEQPASLQGRSILVVDDEESLRELIVDSLSARGALVDSASSGKQALDRIAARQYDAVLCDLHMPEMGGEELYRRLSALPSPPSAKFIFMTGDSAGESPGELLRTAGLRAIQKPFTVSELAATLAEALSVPVGQVR